MGCLLGVTEGSARAACRKLIEFGCIKNITSKSGGEGGVSFLCGRAYQILFF